MAATPIQERVEFLSSRHADLVPFTMPKGSLGDRPWRTCMLTLEETGTLLPVDPARAVRMTPRSPMPAWLDPLYAALGPAVRVRGDGRLNKEDLKRLELHARALG